MKSCYLGQVFSLGTVLFTVFGSTLSLAEETEFIQNETIEVIGITPAHGTGLPVDMIPFSVQSATAEDIERSQSLDLSQFLNRNLGSVTINEAQNNLSLKKFPQQEGAPGTLQGDRNSYDKQLEVITINSSPEIHWQEILLLIQGWENNYL